MALRPRKMKSWQCTLEKRFPSAIKLSRKFLRSGSARIESNDNQPRRIAKNRFWSPPPCLFPSCRPVSPPPPSPCLSFTVSFGTGRSLFEFRRFRRDKNRTSVCREERNGVIDPRKESTKFHWLARFLVTFLTVITVIPNVWVPFQKSKNLGTSSACFKLQSVSGLHWLVHIYIYIYGARACT